MGAPADREPGGHPVVLFSPADRLDRSIDTALVEDLASHGYIVVTVDHTYDSGEVRFPDGQVVVSTLPPDSDQVNTEATAVRVADMKFVLGQLATINAGRDPEAGSRLPRGLAGALDLSEVGMFGFSMGGATTAGAMLADPRIKAGADLDGTIYGPVAARGLDRPFLLVSSQDNGRDVDPTWASLWSHLRGWRLDLRLAGAEHLSFSDAVTLYPPGRGDPAPHPRPAGRAGRHDRRHPDGGHRARVPARLLRPAATSSRRWPARSPVGRLPGNAIRPLTAACPGVRLIAGPG